MLSNLISQLREQNAMDRYQEVLAEMPLVRADLGYPPLVTPSSQIVGTQATLNVLMGERYKVIPQEVKNYVKGMYGRPPAPMSPDIRKRVLGDEDPIDCRPADLLEPEFEKMKQEIGDLATSDEDVLLYAIFPQVARPFLERRARKSSGKEEIIAAIAARIAKEKESLQSAVRATSHLGSFWKHSGRRPSTRFWRLGQMVEQFMLTIDDTTYSIEFKGNQVFVNGYPMTHRMGRGQPESQRDRPQRGTGRRPGIGGRYRLPIRDRMANR